jgi:serine/threonine protein kinase
MPAHAKPPPPPPQAAETAGLPYRLKEWSYEDLADAAAHFAPASKMGEGGFGPVYRGRLDGQEVAIKVLSEQAWRSASNEQRKLIQAMFDTEVSEGHKRTSSVTPVTGASVDACRVQVKILGSWRHTNVVKLLGYSKGADGRLALVYELMEGGSLDQWLRKDGQTASERGPAPTLLER